MIEVTLKDGVIKKYSPGITILEIAKDIGGRLAREAVAAKVDGVLKDLSQKINEDAAIEIVTFNDEEGQIVYRHSTSHVLAQAVQRLFPDAKLAIGPAIKDGFYYDFDHKEPFKPEDLEKIEAEMKKIIKENLPFERFELSREEALEFFGEKNETYKSELIDDLPEGEIISCYRQGDWCDLCAGPHLPSTGKLKAVKLTSVAGAYWRGDERNKMLQRILIGRTPTSPRRSQEKGPPSAWSRVGVVQHTRGRPGVPLFPPQGNGGQERARKLLACGTRKERI